jgi:hypothetical protein
MSKVMKAKIFYLLECIECHHCVSADIRRKAFCVETEKFIEDTSTIPDWCPLEDADLEYLDALKRGRNCIAESKLAELKGLVKAYFECWDKSEDFGELQASTSTIEQAMRDAVKEET